MAGRGADGAARQQAAVAAGHDVVTRIGDHHRDAETVLQGGGKPRRRFDAVAARPVGIDQAAPGRVQGQASRRRVGFGGHAKKRSHLRKRARIRAPSGEFTNIDEVGNLFLQILGNRGKHGRFLRAGDDQPCVPRRFQRLFVTVDLVPAQRCCDRAAARCSAGLAELGAVDFHGAGAIADEHLMA